MRQMKRSSVEPWIENVGETECLEPAFKQNTNDDEFDFERFFYYLIFIKKKVVKFTRF